MTVPGLGPLPLSGFQDPAWLLLLIAPAALLGSYAAAQRRRRRRMRLFADTGAAAPSRWQHLPMAVLLSALAPLSIAVAQPSRDIRVPRNRAVVMLLVDVSQSMMATDISPNRLVAAEHAAQQFAQHVTPGVNLGLIAFAGTPDVLVAPSPDHQLTVAALDKLRAADSTATGEAIFSALQSITTVNAVLKGPDNKPAPATILLLSDGKENKPDDPNDPEGAYTAARAADRQGVSISTIAFGTPAGNVELKNETLPVPVDDEMMKAIAHLSGGQTATATTLDELNAKFRAAGDRLGYQTERGPASAGWLRLAVVMLSIGAVLGLAVNRRLPT